MLTQVSGPPGSHNLFSAPLRSASLVENPVTATKAREPDIQILLDASADLLQLPFLRVLAAFQDLKRHPRGRAGLNWQLEKNYSYQPVACYGAFTLRRTSFRSIPRQTRLYFYPF